MRKQTDSNGISDVSNSDQADKVKEQKRRELLQSLAATGVIASASLVPEKWNKPAVNALLLPAHAETSPSTVLRIQSETRIVAAASGATGTNLGQSEAGNLLASNFLDQVIPKAHAGEELPRICRGLENDCIVFVFTILECNVSCI